jgi:non-specific serine/threonine protein kinase
MGEVFVAEDLRLKRQVALKILPLGVADDPDRRQRFQREAEAIAALDHPNIVTVYSIETATPDSPDGAEAVTFITMQLVEGRTLDELIPPGGMSLPRFLDIALPLTDALSAAHRKGITHRDLKPGNIMAGTDGRIWILDFGLAKFHPTDGEEAPIPPGDGTQATALTREGVVLGTAPYMSPELASGRPVDPRSDIFSLGIIFHEILSGRRPFRGDTPADLVSAILRDTPESISDLRRELPPRIGRIVRRCLEKAPDDRYQTARDLHSDLEELRQDSEASDEAVPAPSGRASDSRGPASDPRSRPLSIPAKPSLAVLPFVNLSDDPEQDYFAAGLAADINADLVKISGLFLISQTTTQLYAKKEIDPRKVGQELGVRHILVGTVRRASNQVRITAQLVDTRTGEPVWADRFDGRLDDLFALQDEITEQIVTALDVKLVHGEGSRISRRSIKNPRARDLFYRALPLAFGQRREDLREGRRLLAEAAGIEPDSPMFSALMAWTHYFEVRLGLSDSPEESIDSATSLADKAIELDDPSGMAYMLKGAIHLMHREHAEALEASEKALADRPSCPWAFALKGSISNYTGRPAEAIELARQAIRLTPLFPPLFPAVLATGHYLCQEADEAIDAARGAIELSPDNLENHVVLAGALTAAGHPDRVASTLEEIHRIKKDFSLDAFAASQPFKDPADLNRMLADLRAAGLR